MMTHGVGFPDPVLDVPAVLPLLLWPSAAVVSKWFPVDVRLISMTRFVVGRWTLASTGVAAVAHALAWPYAVVVLVAATFYRLIAEQSRRKTLVELVRCSPPGTIVIMERGPGGPAMWLRVGDGPPGPVDTSSGGVVWATVMQRSRGVTGRL
jgi:hypothetical protein